MSRHLPLLQQQFPDQILLSVDDIAKCLKWSKGHIYNLSYKKELPFPLIDGKGGVQVSIIAMADYLDGTLEPKVEQPNQSTPVSELVRARRRGRPRGSDLSASLEAMALPDGSESCAEKFDQSKTQIERMVSKAKASMFATVLDLKMPQSKLEVKSKAAKI